MPPTMDGLGDFRRVEVKLRSTIKDLDDLSGTGRSGFRNEYLKALLHNFVDARAGSTLDLLDAFATRYVNAELPPWFYLVFCSVKLVGLVKTPDTSSSQVPDVRPLGLGECLRRTIHSAVVSQYRNTLSSHLWPQQVAVGVPAGISLLVFGARALLELHPDWVIVKIDLRNAYNEISRAKIFERLCENPELRDLAPFFWCTHAAESDVFLAANGLPLASFWSSDGVHQGDPLASSAFCVGIHPEVCKLDQAVAAHGGCAKFDMDDGYAIGPPSVVFDAVQRFAEDVGHLGLTLELGKCACFSPSFDLSGCSYRPEIMPVGALVDQQGVSHFGIKVAGVPVGSSGFVALFMEQKASNVMSKISIVFDKLRSTHLQSLYSVLFYALAPLFHFWIQHCYPCDCLAAATRVDSSLLAVADHCVPGLTADSIALRRLRLPARMYGGGIRSLVDVSHAAFVGAFCRSVPLMLDRHDVHGCLQSGFMPALAPMLGNGSFDVGFESTRFQQLLDTSFPLAVAFRSSWFLMQIEVGALGVEEPDGPLLFRPAAAAGAGHDKVQRDLTRVRERVRFQKLDVDVRALPASDMRRLSWLNLDKFSTVWVAAWPSHEVAFSNAEFAEVTARYFGLPSPACAPFVGTRIPGLRDTVDAFGVRLLAANMRGDGWRLQHDCLKWRIVEDAKEMGVRLQCEVLGVFASSLSAFARESLASLPLRQRQGIVPDFLASLEPSPGVPAEDTLLELKTLHCAPSTYVFSWTRRCEAVLRRADRIPAEYVRKARKLDQRFCGTVTGETGPVERKLASFGEVRGLVFGSWGEASPYVEELLSAFVASGSVRHWRAMRAQSPEEVRGALAWLLRRRWGFTALRESARLLLDRVHLLHPGVSAGTARRDLRSVEVAARSRVAAFSLQGRPVCRPRRRA